MRHKEIHFLNMPPALKYIYDFAKSNMSQKLKERIMVSIQKFVIKLDNVIFFWKGSQLNWFLVQKNGFPLFA